MPAKRPIPPKWITARLGDDMNWWIGETSAEVYEDEGERGLLDPHQISELLKALEPFEAYGYRRELLDAAFQFFQVESELAEDRLRLAPIESDTSDNLDDSFALPLLDGAEMGAYGEFLDVITSARIRQLNATHRFARACTELEMQEELEALDRDRYFSAENIHTFDEISEILQWSPAEWDDSSAV